MIKTDKVITLFGASGKTGRAIINEAKNNGIKIRAVIKRRPTDAELSQSIIGSDAVVIVFGPRPPYTDIFCADMTERIIRVMKKEHVGRLICQTGAMIGKYPLNRSFPFQIMSNIYQTTNPKGYTDRLKQEEVVKTSGLKWTIVKPPKLTEAGSQKEIKAGSRVKVGLMSSLSRTSLAGFYLHEVNQPQYINQVVFIKN